jgi:hypothetical protein
MRGRSRAMSELLAAALFWLILLVPLGVFVQQLRRVRRGTRGRAKAIALFFSYAILPALCYGATFFLLVGVEALTGRALIGEGFARMLLPVVGFALAEVLLLGVIFAITASVLRRSV